MKNHYVDELPANRYLFIYFAAKNLLSTLTHGYSWLEETGYKRSSIKDINNSTVVYVGSVRSAKTCNKGVYTNYDILQEINSQYNAWPTTFGPLRLKR